MDDEQRCRLKRLYILLRRLISRNNSFFCKFYFNFNFFHYVTHSESKNDRLTVSFLEKLVWYDTNSMRVKGF